MKTSVTISQNVCDLCKEHEAYAWNACLFCGKDVCSNCISAARAVRYEHGVFISGSSDGVYCSQCDDQLKGGDADPLHTAYLEIEALRNDLKAWNDAFKVRKEQCEQWLQLLYRQHENRKPKP